jgi:hypothetical protein
MKDDDADSIELSLHELRRGYLTKVVIHYFNTITRKTGLSTKNAH